MVCEAVTKTEDEEGGENHEQPQKEDHGGCSHVQPQIRKRGLKSFLMYKKFKNDEDEEFKAVPLDKRPFSPTEVYNVE